MEPSTSAPRSYESQVQIPPLKLPDFGIGLESMLFIIFLIVFFFWAVYTVVSAYHWFRYSHRSWLAVPAIATHCIVSALIIIYIALGI